MASLVSIAWTALAITFGALLIWLVGLKLINRLLKRFGRVAPCPYRFAWVLDLRPGRWLRDTVLDRIGLRRGERVLEIGPGTGTFTAHAAARVGLEGRLIAVDIQPEMVAKLERRLRTAGITNVTTHVADACKLPLERHSVDRVFMIAALPEVADQDRALAEVRRVLRPRGVLSVTEEFGDPDYPFRFETVRRVEAAGFRLIETFGGLWIYTVNFAKPALH